MPPSFSRILDVYDLLHGWGLHIVELATFPRIIWYHCCKTIHNQLPCSSYASSSAADPSSPPSPSPNAGDGRGQYVPRVGGKET